MLTEDVFFPAQDGVTVEGWFIPADSDRLIVCNHPMSCNRYGYPVGGCFAFSHWR